MRTFASKAGWIIATLLGITIIASWTGVISAGSLDPPGPVGSTMKSLDDIPGSWSRLLSATGSCESERFECVLLNDAAVLDRETGLVWEREWHEATFVWSDAIRACHHRNTAIVADGDFRRLLNSYRYWTPTLSTASPRATHSTQDSRKTPSGRARAMWRALTLGQ